LDAAVGRIDPRRFPFEGDRAACREEYVVRILYPGLSSIAAFGLMLGCLGGLSGCDSKPADGTVVQEGPHMTDEQKEKVKSYRANRLKNGQKTAGKR
jgi:hypothetical protein